MAKIFISYSRVDRLFVDDFLPFLRRVYGNDSYWFDDEIHGGSHWWTLILSEIGKCEVFIYLLSNESIASSYCQDECREALRLHKQVLPIIIRKRTSLSFLPDDLKTILHDIQYIDLGDGTRDSKAISQVYASLNKLLLLSSVVNPQPTTNVPTPEPQVLDGYDKNQSAYPSSHFSWLSKVMLMLVSILTIALILIIGMMSDKDNTNQRSPTSEHLLSQNTSSQITPQLTSEITQISIPELADTFDAKDLTGTSEFYVNASVNPFRTERAMTRQAETSTSQRVSPTPSFTPFSRITITIEIFQAEDALTIILPDYDIPISLDRLEFRTDEEIYFFQSYFPETKPFEGSWCFNILAQENLVFPVSCSQADHAVTSTGITDRFWWDESHGTSKPLAIYFNDREFISVCTGISGCRIELDYEIGAEFYTPVN